MMDKGEIALLIYEAGGVQFGSFKLKLHEQFPEAPESPFYINLRMPPKGRLTAGLIEQIGAYLFNVARREKIFFDHIVGLPKAGEPIARAFAAAASPGKEIHILTLEKEEEEGGRRILPVVYGEFQKGDCVLILDDLITRADTKLEAVRALRENELAVSHCLVLLDREQGGEEGLKKAGVVLHAAFTLTWLFNFLVGQGRITKSQCQEALSYSRRVEAYIAGERQKQSV